MDCKHFPILILIQIVTLFFLLGGLYNQSKSFEKLDSIQRITDTVENNKELIEGLMDERQ